MGARISREQNIYQLFQLISSSKETSFNRHQRALYERLLLNFQVNQNNVLELDEASALELFTAISKFLRPDRETHNTSAQQWMKEFDINGDGKLSWTEFCNAITTLLKGQAAGKAMGGNYGENDAMLSMNDLSLISKIN